jgi:hypothetical protein
MILQRLKGRNVLVPIVVPFILLAFWFRNFINAESLVGNNTQMPLYQFLQYVCGYNTTALNIIAFAFLVIMALLMVRLNERYVFIRQRTDLPALVFAIMATGTIALKGMHPALLATFLLLLAVYQMFGIYNGSSTLAKSFDVGMLIGLATISYLYVGIFIVWFWISLAVLGYFRGREFLAGLVGFLLPLFIAGCWFYWYGEQDAMFATLNSLFHTESLIDWNTIQVAYWGIIGALILISSLFMGNVSEEKKISSRKYFLILLFFFLFTLVSFFTFSGSGVELYFVAMIPLTFIISHYFAMQRHSWMGEVIFAIFLAAGILVHVLS